MSQLGPIKHGDPFIDLYDEHGLRIRVREILDEHLEAKGHGWWGINVFRIGSNEDSQRNPITILIDVDKGLTEEHWGPAKDEIDKALNEQGRPDVQVQFNPAGPMGTGEFD